MSFEKVITASSSETFSQDEVKTYQNRIFHCKQYFCFRKSHKSLYLSNSKIWTTTREKLEKTYFGRVERNRGLDQFIPWCQGKEKQNLGKFVRLKQKKKLDIEP